MTDEARALAACLAAGHALADFAFQTRWMVERKHRVSGLLAHGAVVALSHFVTLVPFLGREVALAAATVTALHLLLDGLKAAISRRNPGRATTWFLLDQIAHVGILVAAWWWLVPRVPSPVAMNLDPHAVGTVGVLVAAYAFNLHGVSALVIGALKPLKLPEDEGGRAVGERIGFLERWLALTFVLAGQWSALGLLVAAKSLARFKDLEQRERAEYYLVGTLASLLGATFTALAVRALI